MLLLFAMMLSMTSCISFGGFLESEPSYEEDEKEEPQYLTEEQIRDIIEEYYTSGDTALTESKIREIIEKYYSNNLNVTVNSSNAATALAASRAMLSVVSINSIFDVESGSTTKKAMAAGSGVIYKLDKVSGDAYIITNYHVVHNDESTANGGISEDIRLYLYGMELTDYVIPATFIGGSANYDIAVLKVSGSDVLRKSAAMAATVADSNNISVLEMVIAVGNPENLGMSATVGYVNVDSEYIDVEITASITASLRVIRTDASMNSGNSGGGLFNTDGELVGIANAKLMVSDNISYAIPSNIAKYIAENIIYYCDGTNIINPQRCLLGVTVTSYNHKVAYDTETGLISKSEDVTIQSVSAGAAADGKLKEGDIIKSITIGANKYEITRMFQVVDSMLNARVGNTVKFEILRGGVPMNVEISITSAALVGTP